MIISKDKIIKAKNSTLSDDFFVISRIESLILENNHEKHIVIFGHNPTISQVAEEMLKTKYVYLKTCSICQINLVESDTLSGELNFIKSPKELT